MSAEILIFFIPINEKTHTDRVSEERSRLSLDAYGIKKQLLARLGQWLFGFIFVKIPRARIRLWCQSIKSFSFMKIFYILTLRNIKELRRIDRFSFERTSGWVNSSRRTTRYCLNLAFSLFPRRNQVLYNVFFFFFKFMQFLRNLMLTEKERTRAR